MITLAKNRSRRQVAASVDAGGSIIRLDSLSLAYGESVVVEDVNLAVAPGQIVALMGRNGAGKTTLLKAIAGIMRPRRGRVLLDGQDASRRPAYTRARSGIGYVPQGRGIFPYLSVLENLLIGLESVGGKDTGQVDEVYGIFPVLKQMGGRTAGVLSGGQQQQLAIARALVGRPRLLMLDEPTEGIQPSIVEEIERVIASLQGKMAILLVEQFLDFALAVTDHCYVMETGRIVLHGPAEALDRGALREYLAV
jgi:urea transport system ATP-binding protein